MKKMGYKKYYQDELWWILGSIFIAFCIIVSQMVAIFLVIRQFFYHETPSMPILGISIVMFFLPPFLLIPEVATRFCWNIYLTKESAYMKGERLSSKRWRIQYPAEVRFSDITSIDIESSIKNSQGQSVSQSWHYGLDAKNTFLVFSVCSSTHKKRFHVSHYSDAKLAEIIEEIVSRIQSSGNKEYNMKHASDILFNRNKTL